MPASLVGDKRRRLAVAGSLLAVVLSWIVLRRASGAAVFATLTGLGLATALLASSTTALLRSRGSLLSPVASSLMLAVASLGIGLVVLELIFAAARETAVEEVETLVPEPLRFVRVGGERDFRLLGVLHAHNPEGYRTRPFTPPRDDVLRILALGDSLTFGQGLPEEDRYTERIERRLGARYRVEILNLGQMGHSSEDVLREARSWLARLEPDVILYGHCLNDFLPAGVGQYESNLRWRVPLPRRMKKALVQRTRLGGLVSERYDRLLMQLDVRRDFFDDILVDFDGYVTRFAADMKALNDLVVSHGLPPVVALVLNQYPGEERGRAIGSIAEEKMREAGMTVLPSDYVEEYATRDVRLHLEWDGHPNAYANELFAQAFLRHFSSESAAAALEPYAR